VRQNGLPNDAAGRTGRPRFPRPELVFSRGDSITFPDVISGSGANAGHAQIGGGAVGNNLVVGSWVGQNGVIGVNTVLGGDNSPSDRLLINGGSATGASILQVTNVGGLGAVTWGNGLSSRRRS